MKSATQSNTFTHAGKVFTIVLVLFNTCLFSQNRMAMEYNNIAAGPSMPGDKNEVTCICSTEVKTTEECETVSKTELFKMGFQDAKKHYKAPQVLTEAILVSLSPKGSKEIYFMTHTPVNPDKNIVSNRIYLSDPDYIAGYQKAANTIKKRRTMGGFAIGKSIVWGVSLAIISSIVISSGH